METEWQALFEVSGGFGIASLVSGGVLFLLGVALVTLARARKLFVLYLFVSLTPVYVGLFATMLAGVEVNEKLAVMGEELSEARHIAMLVRAWYPTWLGAVAAAPALVAGLAGLVVHWRERPGKTEARP